MAKTILIADDSASVRQALCELKREADLRSAEKQRTGKRRLRKLWNCT